MKNPKSNKPDQHARIIEAKERYEARKFGRPKQRWDGRQWVKLGRDR